MGTDPIFLRAALSNGKWGLSLFFEDCRNPHSAGCADRNEPAARAAVGELLRQPGDDARAGGAERMTDGDAAALRVHLRAIDRAQRLRAFEAGTAARPPLPAPPPPRHPHLGSPPVVVGYRGPQPRDRRA